MSKRSRFGEKSITNLDTSAKFTTQQLNVSGSSTMNGDLTVDGTISAENIIANSSLTIAGPLKVSSGSAVDPTVNGQVTGPFINGTDIVFKSRVGGIIYTHTILGV